VSQTDKTYIKYKICVKNDPNVQITNPYHRSAFQDQ